MTMVNKDFLIYAESELTSELMYFSNLELNQANQLAKNLVNKIDWNNSALMHKGFSWIAKNSIAQLA
mgnify:CR=1 FL=1